MVNVENEWFDDVPVVGALAADKALAKLREVGEYELANQIEGKLAAASISVDAFGSIHLLPDKAWQHTEHTFGYIKTTLARQTKSISIQHADNILADESLKNSRIKITLDRLRIVDYPGSGIHLVLFDFYARNQVSNHVEDLHFNTTYRVREGEHAAVIGYPIFVGLNVGSEGITFGCFTVNVKNDNDKDLLGFLDSDVFKAGLQLISTIQPAITPLSGMALGLTKAIATRRRNVPVEDIHVGLDFSNIPFRARLAEGSYVVVQIPEKSKTIWDWAEWVYDPHLSQIVKRRDHKQLIPYNYMVFGVSRHKGD
ncbi:MAG TPA: hypothetical protein VMW72_04085 [Sedimentisphaerales bacterium]|nr:hypothetical protein [Sedimentisphaerales bacterium]